MVEGIRSKKASPPLATVVIGMMVGSGLLLVLVGAFPFSRSFPLLVARLLVPLVIGPLLLLRLMSAVPFATLLMVSVVSFSFCFILTAVIVGTSLGFGAGSRCFADPNGVARLPVLVVGEMRLMPLLLLLLGESIFRFPPLDGATASGAEAFKRFWWASSVPMGETVVPPTPASAAARSLEDLVVRIGCGCG